MGHTPDHGVGANFQELVNANVASEDDPVCHLNMTGDADGIREYDVIPYLAVMGNMHIGHQQIIAADARYPAAATGAPVQGYTLANDIVITYLQPGLLTYILLVRRVFTYGTELIDLIIATDAGVRADDDIGSDVGVGTDTDIWPDNTLGSNTSSCIELSFGIDSGTAINRHPSSSRRTISSSFPPVHHQPMPWLKIIKT